MYILTKDECPEKFYQKLGELYISTLKNQGKNNLDLSVNSHYLVTLYKS